MDNGQLACLCLLARLLQGELEKCLRLVISLPMADMDKHFGELMKKLLAFVSFKKACYKLDISNHFKL